MKKLDLSQTVSILANIGVIAGIVFLGIELRQNNELMAAEARFNNMSLSTQAFAISSQPDIAAIYVKDRNGEELTEVEYFMIESHWMRGLVSVFKQMGQI